MAFIPNENALGIQPIATTSTTRQHPLGTRVRASDDTYGAGTFVYAKGVASTVVGSAVILYPDDWTTALASTATTGFVGVAMSANVANQYGWYQVIGKGVVKAATVVDNANVWATATPGTVDDATADGYMIHNAWFASADGTPSAGLAEIELMEPYIDGIATND